MGEGVGPAVVILSGGLDSTVCMAMAAQAGEPLWALTFDYGQRHRCELAAATAVARHYGAEHQVIALPEVFAVSALTDMVVLPEIDDDPARVSSIPVTYVPARNVLFLSHALAMAEKVGAGRILIGVNALDHAGYPDCRPEFIAAFQQVIDVGTKAGVEGRGVRIETPLLYLTKREIVLRGIAMQAPLALTHTCYYGEVPACGVCDSCRLRLVGFAEAGVSDPIAYQR